MTVSLLKVKGNGALGLLVHPASIYHYTCSGCPSNGSLTRALTSLRSGKPSLGDDFALRCSQRLFDPRAAFQRCN